MVLNSERITHKSGEKCLFYTYIISVLGAGIQSQNTAIVTKYICLIAHDIIKSCTKKEHH